jgi:hypothetical protein
MGTCRNARGTQCPREARGPQAQSAAGHPQRPRDARGPQEVPARDPQARFTEPRLLHGARGPVVGPEQHGQRHDERRLRQHRREVQCPHRLYLPRVRPEERDPGDARHRVQED